MHATREGESEIDATPIADTYTALGRSIRLKFGNRTATGLRIADKNKNTVVGRRGCDECNRPSVQVDTPRPNCSTVVHRDQSPIQDQECTNCAERGEQRVRRDAMRWIVTMISQKAERGTGSERSGKHASLAPPRLRCVGVGLPSVAAVQYIYMV